MLRHNGYELHNRALAMAAVFPSIESSLAFASEMQHRVAELTVPEDLLSIAGFDTQKDTLGRVVFKGLRVKAGVAIGTPEMRRLVPSTGRAMYSGDIVQLAAHLMVVACPGQIIVDGQGLMQYFQISEEPFKKTLIDRTSEPIPISSKNLSSAGCSTLFVRVLGYFKMDAKGGMDRHPLADIVTPSLSHRTFTLPPGRIGLRSGNGEIDSSQRQVRVSNTGGKSQKLTSMLVDILHQRHATTAASGTEDVQVKGMLGQGKQGKVMLGKWKGVDVAYKVIQLPEQMSKTDSAETRALLEMAISATMAHPNVVQTYSYEVVHIEAGQAGTPGAGGGPKVDDTITTSEAETHEDGSAILDAAASEDIMQSASGQGYQEARLIQELCDKNTLRHCLNSKVLCSKGEKLPHVGLMVILAHDVACGLQHIHSQSIVHGDLKALKRPPELHHPQDGD
ncbi:uncharacterized protein LOC142356349 [Convolutriloba macropyga]|uniref:uncharacterized protein LOC142356349 n=1 Tax=Convolutriloba macropyga TaxID=536237 RepID=UPI003F529065